MVTIKTENSGPVNSVASKGLTWERTKVLRKAAAENLFQKTLSNKESGIPELTPEPGKKNGHH